MKMYMVVTRDIVSNVHGIPVFVPHIGQAIRSFGDECRRKDTNNVLGNHPEDFELWLIGEYDDERADFTIEGHTVNPNDPSGSPTIYRKKQIAVGANYRD